MTKIEDVVRKMTETKINEMGLELLDIELKSGVLRITLDSESALDLDRVANASTVISGLIDESSEFENFGPFTLEVSSPGVERTLRTASHFRRFTNTKVSIKAKSHVEGPRRIIGVIETVDDSEVVVVIDSPDQSDTQRVKLNIDDIERAHTVFEWGLPRPPKTSGTKKRAERLNSSAKELAKD